MTKLEELERRILLKQQLMILIQEEIIILAARLEAERQAGIKWRAEERGTKDENKFVFRRPLS